MEVLWDDTYDVDTAAPPLATGEWIVTLPLRSRPSLIHNVKNDYDNNVHYDRDEIPALPALACPPVWWIVLDASVPVGNSYWKTMAEVLGGTSSSSWSSLWGDIPAHVHVGLLAVSSTTCTVYDLTSSSPDTVTPTHDDDEDNDDDDDEEEEEDDPSSPSYHPHVLHYPLTTRNVPLSLVPADATHKATIQATLHALATMGAGAVPSTHPQQQSDNKDHGKETEEEGDMSDWSPPGMVLSVALEKIGRAHV